MSNDLVVSQNSGAAQGGAATEGFSGGVAREGFASFPADSTRKAEIEAIMNTDFDRYEREGLNREYLAILEAELVAADPNSGEPTRPMASSDSRIALCGSVEGQRLVLQWERMGGFNAHLANVQRDVGAIVRSVGGNREQRVFMERFDRAVPEPARLAVYDEIAAGPPSFVTPATQAEIEGFAQTQTGKDLVAEWGRWAPEKVARLRARAHRMTDRMDENDAIEFWHWFEGLEASLVARIFRKLAG